MYKDLKAEPHLPEGKFGVGIRERNAVVGVEKQEEYDKAKNGVLSPSASRA